MLGTLRYDERGMVVEVSDTLWSEPVLITRAWRVTAVEASMPPQDGMGVSYRDGLFYGGGCRFGTAELPERTEETPLKPPSKRHVWRDGDWKRGR